jgi:cyclase
LFVPLTVGGGVRSVDDARALLQSGADKVAVNSAAVAEPSLLTRLAEAFGSQCIVLAVDALRTGTGWRVVTHAGRRSTPLGVADWCVAGTLAGAGEILLTSIDRDGTGDGYDLALIRAVCEAVSVPVVASGGAGEADDFTLALQAGAHAALAASLFHDRVLTIEAVKVACGRAGLPMRMTP